MGAATINRLMTAGHEVFNLDIAAPTVDATEYIECDLSNKNSIDAALESLPKNIDAVANVAGIPGPLPGERVISVNFLGLRHLTEALVPRIADGGSIVIVASVAGHNWQRRFDVVTDFLNTTDFDSGVSWLAENEEKWNKDPYTFSKQCAVAYTYRVSGKAISRGVRANCVNPGAIQTQLTANFRAQIGEETYDWSVDQMGRHGTPDEVAEVIEYLATGPCRWLNGEELSIDGGFNAGIVGGWIDISTSPAALARKNSSL
jgi:NAD(P)-dependent dehydrogenase (short-subunit alcohol dehydrogenase family)